MVTRGPRRYFVVIEVARVHFLCWKPGLKDSAWPAGWARRALQFRCLPSGSAALPVPPAGRGARCLLGEERGDSAREAGRRAAASVVWHEPVFGTCTQSW